MASETPHKGSHSLGRQWAMLCLGGIEARVGGTKEGAGTSVGEVRGIDVSGGEGGKPQTPPLVRGGDEGGGGSPDIRGAMYHANETPGI